MASHPVRRLWRSEVRAVGAGPAQGSTWSEWVGAIGRPQRSRARPPAPSGPPPPASPVRGAPRPEVFGTDRTGGETYRAVWSPGDHAGPLARPVAWSPQAPVG